MAASLPRERRRAIWPSLVMPLVVVLVFYALLRVHQHNSARGAHAASPPAAVADGTTQP